MKKFLYNAAVEIVLFGSLFAWVANDSAGGENMFKFIVWFMAILGMIFAVTKEGKKTLREAKRSDTQIAYFATRNIILVAACAWMGLIVLAAMFAVTCLLISGARNAKTITA